jgi:predicted DNA-binding transcriptional regulator YafY
MKKEKTTTNQKQNERISFIDFCANFLGVVSRADLMDRFGISDGSASKDLSSYIKLAPDNLKYDFKSKSHYTTKHFKPLFAFTVTQALKALSTGFGDTLEQTRTPFVVAESAIELNKPKTDIIVQVSRAINLKKIVELQYKSLSSGETIRKIAPLVIINSGLRWHVRTFDRKTSEFRDFVFTRMLKAKLTEEDHKANESLKHDDSWNQMITLELAPHPGNITEKDSIAMDYGMIDGKVEVTIRKAVAGYVLRQWNVDCTDDHKLDGKHFQLWLKNKKSIKGIDEVILAPGINGDS